MAVGSKAKSKQGEQQFNPDTYPYIKCREQHDWKYYDGTILEAQREVHIVMRCSRCLTKRPRVLSLRSNSRGMVDATSYRHPKDYHVKGGLTARERGEVRLRNALAMLAEHGVTAKKKGR